MGDLRTSLEVTDSFARASFWLGDIPIGHAYIAIDGGNAELGDIVLYERGSQTNRLLRSLTVTRNYRRRGYGSVLMPQLKRARKAAGRCGAIV